VGNLDAVSGLRSASALRPGSRAWQLDARPSRAALPAPEWSLRPGLLILEALAIITAAVLAAPTRAPARTAPLCSPWSSWPWVACWSPRRERSVHSPRRHRVPPRSRSTRPPPRAWRHRSARRAAASRSPLPCRSRTRQRCARPVRGP
jgi:hypothetical protein